MSGSGLEAQFFWGLKVSRPKVDQKKASDADPAWERGVYWMIDKKLSNELLGCCQKTSPLFCNPT